MDTEEHNLRKHAKGKCDNFDCRTAPDPWLIDHDPVGWAAL